MPRIATTPRDLAARLSREVDDVLLMLWDAGIEYPKGPLSLIRAEDRLRAEQACGLASPKERTSVAYWQHTLGKDHSDFRIYAESLGVRVGERARRLPKGALAKLERANPKVTLTLEAEQSPTEVLVPATRFVWADRGHTRKQLQYLDVEDIEGIHWAIAYDFADTSDPISPAGVRDPGLLQSAASRPRTGSMDVLKYSTVEMAAAALMHSVVHNHPFYNGNKRTALVSMLAFLDLNRFVLESTQDALFKWTIRVASHGLNKKGLAGDIADIEVSAMTEWLVSHTRPIDHSQRVVTTAALGRRLEELGCEVTMSGMKLNVSRVVAVGSHARPWARRPVLKHSIPYMGEGRQVPKSRVQNLRRALHLSEEHGVDAGKFFGTDKTPIDEFISRYRKTLSRLAKV